MQKQFTNTNMIYIMALFMALIPYGRSLDCTCSPSSPTGAAINGAGRGYRNDSSFTYNSDGSFDATNVNYVNAAVSTGVSSYPAFRIDDYYSTRNNDYHDYYYVFCYRTGGFGFTDSNDRRYATHSFAILNLICNMKIK